MIDKLLYIHIFSYWSAVYYYMYKYDQWSLNSTKIMKSVFWNQVLYSPLYIIPYQYYPVPLSTYNVVWQLPLIVILTDVIFYICHRYFHFDKRLYNKYHYRHHEYDPPIAGAALYAHPMEHIFINLLSTVAPMFIVRSNLIVSSIWTIIASVNVVIAHSCTWPKDPHIVHHKYKKYNYGVGLLLMDRILGTYKEE